IRRLQWIKISYLLRPLLLPRFFGAPLGPGIFFPPLAPAASFALEFLLPPVPDLFPLPAPFGPPELEVWVPPEFAPVVPPFAPLGAVPFGLFEPPSAGLLGLVPFGPAIGLAPLRCCRLLRLGCCLWPVCCWAAGVSFGSGSFHLPLRRSRSS